MQMFEKQNKLRFGQHSSIPIRGPVRMQAQDDPPSERPQLVKDAHVRTFELWNPEDLEDYRKVVELVANERGRFGFFDAQWVDETRSWVVLVHWVEYYKEDPDRARKKKLNL